VVAGEFVELADQPGRCLKHVRTPLFLVNGFLVNVIEMVVALGHRVEARRAKWSAPTQATNAEPRSSSGTIFLDGLPGVFGTRRGEPAR
jgi:hypothetical protein